MDLNALHIFVVVARTRNFRRAALELKLTPSAVSHSMSKLEQSLGARLLHRTTRSVSLSEAGEALLRKLGPAMQDIEQAFDDVNSLRQSPRGVLRLNVPRAAAHLVLAPRLTEFYHHYPELQLEVVVSDQLVDIVEEGFDAGIRFGESLQQDMVAIPIGPTLPFVTCAAPSYLQKHGIPNHPDQLLQHNCLQFRFPSGALYAWEFLKRQKLLKVVTTGSFVSDDFQTLVRASMDGLGICYTYQSYVEHLIASGYLQEILHDYMPPAERMYLYFPSRAQLPMKLRAFIDFFKTE
ncbi:LysR family transcriptional regulator [Undibacterium cyanobacteriorum]|uniref:LysR family transcriptional regulator n=1 Tax=Undibacterium cyanobacteriorum TaxID=3073561 RepID=A0ABY9RF97_9BURK|nr:LysR family transcriptional regulator [Undibacterium sp. 20NA77.5]WMW79519.1 LysR family transcriptional regulator [Undibacterium sp. 20NA77.5]